MRRLTLAALALLLAIPVFAAADLTGKWSGSFKEAGSTDEHSDVIYLDLKQTGTALTGVAGPDATQNWPLTNGKVDGNKATFTVQMKRGEELGPTISFQLTLVDDHLKGDMKAEFNGQSHSAVLDLQRQK